MRIGVFSGLVLVACSSAAPPAHAPTAPSAAPARAHDAAPTAWTTIPEFDVRIGCAGKADPVVHVQAVFADIVTVSCGQRVFSVERFTHHATLDEAIDELRADLSGPLQSSMTHEARTAHTYRLEHTNERPGGVNYWADVAIELDGEGYLCIPSPEGSAAAARANADVCMTLEPAP